MWRMSRLASASAGEAASRRSPLLEWPPASSSRAPLSLPASGPPARSRRAGIYAGPDSPRPRRATAGCGACLFRARTHRTARRSAASPRESQRKARARPVSGAKACGRRARRERRARLGSPQARQQSRSLARRRRRLRSSLRIARRAPGPEGSCGLEPRRASRDLAYQALGRLAREPGAVLMRL